jgi:hypothetical protein
MNAPVKSAERNIPAFALVNILTLLFLDRGPCDKGTCIAILEKINGKSSGIFALLAACRSSGDLPQGFDELRPR